MIEAPNGNAEKIAQGMVVCLERFGYYKSLFGYYARNAIFHDHFCAAISQGGLPLLKELSRLISDDLTNRKRYSRIKVG